MENRPDMEQLQMQSKKITNKLSNIRFLQIDRLEILEKIKLNIPELYSSAEIRSETESEDINYIKFIVEIIPYIYQKSGTYISANNLILLNYMKFLKYIRDIINIQFISDYDIQT